LAEKSVKVEQLVAQKNLVALVVVELDLQESDAVVASALVDLLANSMGLPTDLKGKHPGIGYGNPKEVGNHNQTQIVAETAVV
jgi:hypothetical protein